MFPTGRFLSRRWAWIGACGAFVLVGFVTMAMLDPEPFYGEDAAVEWLPFDLHPEYPAQGIPRADLLARYGERFTQTVKDMAAEAGMTYNPHPQVVPRSRAALELAEAVTRVADRGDPVPDEIWTEVIRHYDEQGVCALLIAITGVNVWNRLNAATRQVAGAWSP